MEQEQMEMNNFVGYPRYPDYINVVRHINPISKEKWKQGREYSQEKDNAKKIFCENQLLSKLLRSTKVWSIKEERM